MTIECPDGKQYLAYRDGRPVLPLPDDGVLRHDDLDPNSRAIVLALVEARKHAEEERAELDPGVYAAVIQLRVRSQCRNEAEARERQSSRGLPWITDPETLAKAQEHNRRSR